MGCLCALFECANYVALLISACSVPWGGGRGVSVLSAACFNIYVNLGAYIVALQLHLGGG
jgi:hypothetical protein